MTYWYLTKGSCRSTSRSGRSRVPRTTVFTAPCLALLGYARTSSAEYPHHVDPSSTSNASVRGIKYDPDSRFEKDDTKSLRTKELKPTDVTNRRPFAYIWINVFSRKGVFGVESEHFSTVFAVREVLEASSQTYQAYRASNLLPRAGMNALIVDSQRAANYEVIGCRAVTRPWFSNGKEPCSSLVYDCHARNTTSPDDSSFDKLDHVTLATLAIAHCPELKMPPDSSVPSPPRPTHVCCRFLWGGLKWQNSRGTTATVTGITNECAVLGDQSSKVAGRPVHRDAADISDDASGYDHPELRLTHNPLRELPAALMAPDPFIMSLNVQNTSLTTMPTWVKTNTKVVWAYDTPFCATPMADPALAYQVMCFARPPGQEAFFPMYLFDVLYRIENTT
ncbi:hypothetical protein GQ600_2942 [Phytophthora cactorum]|nr:hypothetical protein GQ600_2942 [Phytophthora cactorum]